MKSKYILSFLVLGVLLFGACASDKRESDSANGDGVAMLSLKFDDVVEKELSRAIITDKTQLDELNSSAKVRIYSSNNKLVRLYEGMDKVPEKISLMADAYMLSVNAGTLTYAGFDKPYYTGSVPFLISKGDIKSVSLTCKLANTLLSVDFDSSLEKFFDISTAKVQATTADTKYGLTFVDTTSRKGYLMFSDENADRNIVLKFTAKTLTNQDYEYSYTITNAKATTEYGVTFRYSEPATPNDKGGSCLDILIDEQVVNKSDNILLVERPRLSGGEAFDINAPIYFEPASGTRTVVWVTTASQLENLKVSSDLFVTHYGLEKSEYDMCKLSATDKALLAGLGITADLENNAHLGQTSGKLVFTDEFMSTFRTDGEYNFAITAIDYVKNTTTEVLNFIVSSATVVALDVDEGKVYSRKAVLRGEIVDSERATGPFTFKYKAATEDTWITVPAVLGSDGITLTADLRDLTPLTAYQFRAVDNGFEGVVTKIFTTEDESQLPNGGFEYWAQGVPGAYTSALTLSSEKGTLFWDCGNHGSNTMSKLVTNPAKDARPGSSGTKSSMMVSQFVGLGSIGKFAAGNMFVGRYAGTDGTDGVLDFGRSFECRPSAYKFWYKYKSGVVQECNIPSGMNVDGMQAGGRDIGKIYVAIGDWDSPVVIKTKGSTSGGGQLFKVDDPHIIAYGEYEMHEDVEAWKEITVDLEYRSTDRKPKYIIICVSASKYGDYFSGGEGSTLYMDDLELIYE